MTRTVADWITEFLGKQGVEFIFSHPGGPVLPLYESMRSTGTPKNILVRHEGAGSFMAEAYAKVTGRAGVCMSTMGPGAANMTIGVGTALSDSTPLIAITGQMTLGNIGRGYQQETDHNALFRGITKTTIQLKQAQSAPENFERAYRLAVSGRPGPVHVDIPVDISGTPLDFGPPPTVEVLREGPANRDAVTAAARLIDKAETPVILAGGGVIISGASDQVRSLAELLSIPVATSYNGRGAIPEDHPLSLGRIGEYTPSYARRIADSADLLIAIGYRFTDVSMDGWKTAQDTKIVQIDIDATEIGKTNNVAVGLVGDARATLTSLLSEIQHTGSKPRIEWGRRVEAARAAWRKAHSSIESSDAVPIKPQRVMKELAALLEKENFIVTSGAGRAKMWPASVLPILRPRTWIHSGGYATMGYELCAALAAKLARPDARVVSIGGDASFQMHCQELATAVEYEAPFVSVILNDQSLGSIRNSQLKKYGTPFDTEFKLDVNLAEVAAAFGAEGRRITKPSDIAAAFKEALESDKPSVLDVKVDGSEVPTLEY